MSGLESSESSDIPSYILDAQFALKGLKDEISTDDNDTEKKEPKKYPATYQCKSKGEYEDMQKEYLSMVDQINTLEEARMNTLILKQILDVYKLDPNSSNQTELLDMLNQPSFIYTNSPIGQLDIGDGLIDEGIVDSIERAYGLIVQDNTSEKLDDMSQAPKNNYLQIIDMGAFLGASIPYATYANDILRRLPTDIATYDLQNDKGVYISEIVNIGLKIYDYPFPLPMEPLPPVEPDDDGEFDYVMPNNAANDAPSWIIPTSPDIEVPLPSYSLGEPDIGEGVDDIPVGDKKEEYPVEIPSPMEGLDLTNYDLGYTFTPPIAAYTPTSHKFDLDVPMNLETADDTFYGSIPDIFIGADGKYQMKFSHNDKAVPFVKEEEGYIGSWMDWIAKLNGEAGGDHKKKYKHTPQLDKKLNTSLKNLTRGSSFEVNKSLGAPHRARYTIYLAKNKSGKQHYILTKEPFTSGKKIIYARTIASPDLESLFVNKKLKTHTHDGLIVAPIHDAPDDWSTFDEALDKALDI